jgi:hypothetical protein
LKEKALNNSNMESRFMMTAKDVIRQVIEFGQMVVQYYVGDLSDAELLVRSVPGSNHIAWQLGHMIAGTQHILRVLGHSAPELPPGFAAAYTKETSGSDDPSKFTTKEEYLRLLEEMKKAVFKAIEDTPENALDQPGPEEMRAYAPTVSSALLLLGNHLLMHAGQWVPIRRKLGRAALF